MAKRKVVVALGGNAILSTDASAKAQQESAHGNSKVFSEIYRTRR